MSQHNEIQQLVQSWIEAQEQIWGNWLEVVNKGGDGAEAWKRAIDSWQASVDRTLESQSKAMQAWAERAASIEGAPDESKRFARDGLRMLEQWSAAQRQLWDQWFSLLRQSVPSSVELPGSVKLGDMTKGWEDAIKRMQEAQRQWAGAWMPSAAKPGAAKRAAKK